MRQSSNGIRRVQATSEIRPASSLSGESMATPPDRKVHRRLAAIMAADVVSFAARMGHDEEGTHAMVQKLRRDILEPSVSDHQGRIVKTTGDGFLVEFVSPVEAVRCAIAMQEAIAAEPSRDPADTLQVRIGVNLGDIIVDEDGDIYGEGVNIAARLEQLAQPGGICVSGKIHDEVKGKLAGTFHDLGEQYVKNIGTPVRVYSLTLPTEMQRRPTLALPDRPSIAVLPFANLSGEPEQEYFADGLVEDIITGLSRVRSFFVIARNSSFTYKHRIVDVRQISRELGVQYILEGSIRKAGSRVRISGQLVDGTTGHHVWADRFDGDMNDIFELQDQVTESVVDAVEPSIRLEEIRQSHRRPTRYVGAYDLYLRALPGFYGMTREGFEEVRRLTNEALSIDPDFTLARALGAYIRSISVSQSWHEPDDARVAIRMATEVLAQTRDDPTSLRFAAQVLAYSAKDYETALGAIERSLYLNPSSAQGYTGSGWVNTYAGHPLVAIDHFHRAFRLSPFDPEKGIALSGMGISYLMLDRFEEALAAGERALREMPNYGTSYRVVIMALVGLNRLDEARVAAGRLMNAFPKYTLSLQTQINPWRDRAFGERYVDALRAAGIPE